ncbi:hypothetical protein AB205_0210080, partial [Aquarana catesbeiana]
YSYLKNISGVLLILLVLLAIVFTVSVERPLHSVHLKLPEDNCWCSHTNNTTGRQLLLLAAVSVYIYTSQLCAATSHCRPLVCLEGQQGEADSHKPIKEGKRALCLEATVLVVETVHPQHVALAVLSRNMQKPSSSSLTQALGTLSGKAAANVASSFGSMASVNPSLAPPCPPEESPELFDHSVGYMLQENAQCFEGSDDGTQLEEGS